MGLRRKTVCLITSWLMLLATLATSGTQYGPRAAFAAEPSYPPIVAYGEDCTPGISRLDVVFLIDHSGSMGSVLEAARDEAVAIANRVNELVPDSGFGVASYDDYPIYAGSGDVAYTEQSRISTNLDDLQTGVNSIDLLGGGDYPEAVSRGVFEMRDFNWRDGARRIVVMIGDAPPHSQGSEPYDDGKVDPGRDGVVGTADDLETFAEAVGAAGGAGISFVALLAETASGIPSAVAAFEYVSSATGGRYAIFDPGASIADPIAEGIAGVVCEGPPAPPPPPAEEEEQEDPAFVTVVQHPTPNLSVVAGNIVTLDIVATNHGEGRSGDTTIMLPFNPSEVRVVSAAFSDDGAWISRLESDWLEIRTGDLEPNDVLTTTLRLETLGSVVIGAPLGDRAVYSWSDAERGGRGRTNLPVLMVGSGNVNLPYYPVTIEPAAGTAEDPYTFASNIFKPDEPVSFWYNSPGGGATAVTRIMADPEGTAGVTFQTTGLAAGAYSMVAQGQWSNITAVGNFTVR